MPGEFEIAAEPPPDLAVCSAEEAESFLEDEEETCPAASKVGTASVGLSITPNPLVGNIYLSAHTSESPDQLFFLTAGYGLKLEQVLRLKSDEQTGGLIASFVQPHLPIESYDLHIFGGEDGLFLTPIYCGDYETSAKIESYASEAFARHLEGGFTIDKGPAGAPCLGAAEEVVVELQPSTIPADGQAQATAHLAVLDEHGTPLPAELELSSSDPDQQMGPVEELSDGTYEATIQASSTPGASTITATDLASELSGSAQLVQIDPNPPGPSLQPKFNPQPLGHAPGILPGAPTVRFSRSPSHHTHNRKPTFRFQSSSPKAEFECALDKAAFKACSPPMALPRLSLGRHRFMVRAHIQSGPLGPLAVYHFTILRR